MSEQPNNHNDRDFSRVHKAEALSHGHIMQPDEVLEVEYLSRQPIKPASLFKFGGEIGDVIAAPAGLFVEIGGKKEPALLSVVDLRAHSERPSDFGVIVYGRNRGRNPDSFRSLPPGEMVQIGREAEIASGGLGNQEIMPDSVSRDHMAIGMDETGNLVIENHNPLNATRVIAD